MGIREEREEIYDLGYRRALDTYGIWKDGVQRIGCFETPIKECKPDLFWRSSDLNDYERREGQA